MDCGGCSLRVHDLRQHLLDVHSIPLSDHDASDLENVNDHIARKECWNCGEQFKALKPLKAHMGTAHGGGEPLEKRKKKRKAEDGCEKDVKKRKKDPKEEGDEVVVEDDGMEEVNVDEEVADEAIKDAEADEEADDGRKDDGLAKEAGGEGKKRRKKKKTEDDETGDDGAPLKWKGRAYTAEEKSKTPRKKEGDDEETTEKKTTTKYINKAPNAKKTNGSTADPPPSVKSLVKTLSQIPTDAIRSRCVAIRAKDVVQHDDIPYLIEYINRLEKWVEETKPGSGFEGSNAEMQACTICIELFTLPQLLECGHSFCYECIHSWLLTNKRCPICRTRIAHPPATNLALADQVHTYVQQLPNISTRDAYKRSLVVARESFKRTGWDALFPPVGSYQFVRGLLFKDEEDGVLRQWFGDAAAGSNSEGEGGGDDEDEESQAEGDEDEEDEDSESEESDDSMDGFIVNDDREHVERSRDEERGWHRRVIEEDESESGSEDGGGRGGVRRRIVGYSDEDESPRRRLSARVVVRSFFGRRGHGSEVDESPGRGRRIVESDEEEIVGGRRRGYGSPGLRRPVAYIDESDDSYRGAAKYDDEEMEHHDESGDERRGYGRNEYIEDQAEEEEDEEEMGDPAFSDADEEDQGGESDNHSGRRANSNRRIEDSDDE
ncbi:E3 ubiquitin ligase [Irineochytrium annulatum]|nr:E3 ubiquitin ligase [Irineochytrium annulatum]